MIEPVTAVVGSTVPAAAQYNRPGPREIVFVSIGIDFYSLNDLLCCCRSKVRTWRKLTCSYFVPPKRESSVMLIITHINVMTFAIHTLICGNCFYIVRVN